MDFVENILEYYDELFPVEATQKVFYEKLIKSFDVEPKMLSIGCGTGVFEYYLARQKWNVTGIETNTGLLESATRKGRQAGIVIRFFEMTSLEMSQFLGKKFYNVISCINNRISWVSDSTLAKKFFADCVHLLASGGHLILQLPNYYKYTKEAVMELPVTESIRSKLHTKIFNEDGKTILLQQVETSNGNLVTIIDNKEVLPLTMKELENLGKDNGFKNIEFYSDFSETAFDKETSPFLVCKMTLK